MKSRLLLFAGVAVFAFALVLAVKVLPGQAEGVERTPLKIGIVDLGKIVDTYARRVDLEEQLKVLIDPEQKKAKAMQEMIQDTRKAIADKEAQQVDEYDEAYVNLKNVLEMYQIQLKQQMTKLKRMVDVGKARILWQIYQDFDRYCAKYAQINAFDFVMADNRQTKLEESYDNLILKISMQPIYYYHPSMDVTQLLMAYMNEEYAKERGAAPAVNGPTPPADNQPK
ncbi:MAG: OmpH family outer membrane protein [Candidatus Brocadiia bacterium]